MATSAVRAGAPVPSTTRPPRITTSCMVPPEVRRPAATHTITHEALALPVRAPSSALGGAVPAAVGFGRVDLGLAGRAHATGRGERLDLGDVDRRPVAARSPGRVALKEPGPVERLPVARDPAPHEAAVDQLVVRHRRDPRVRLGDLHPDALDPTVVGGQPGVPRAGVLAG